MYSRPAKLDHLDTVIYEIDMLEYSYSRLTQKRLPLGTREGYAHLECYLLHFRNLIEFFNGHPRFPDDLNISSSGDWARGRQLNDKDIGSLTKPDLWEKYEGQEKLDKISRYLQHCTRQRVEAKSWQIEEMHRELEPLLTKLRSLFLDWKPVAVEIRGGFVVREGNAHTATIETYDSPLNK